MPWTLGIMPLGRAGRTCWRDGDEGGHGLVDRGCAGGDCVDESATTPSGGRGTAFDRLLVRTDVTARGEAVNSARRLSTGCRQDRDVTRPGGHPT
jgi:hypothetical protein